MEQWTSQHNKISANIAGDCSWRSLVVGTDNIPQSASFHSTQSEVAHCWWQSLYMTIHRVHQFNAASIGICTLLAFRTIDHELQQLVVSHY